MLASRKGVFFLGGCTDLTNYMCLADFSSDKVLKFVCLQVHHDRLVLPQPGRWNW